MLTRITYRYRDLARAALREVLADEPDQRHVLPEAVIVTLVDRFINVAKGLSCQRLNPADGALDRDIGRLLAKAAQRSPKGRPAWATTGQVVLHLTERMLDISPSGEPLASTLPSTVVLRRRSRLVGTYSTPDLVVGQMSRQLLRALEAEGRVRADIIDLSLEGGHFAHSMLVQRPRAAVRFFGIDRDPAALRLARRLLDFSISHAGCDRFEFRTTTMNSLVDRLPRKWPEKFDAVIGNPPWKTRHSIDSRSLRGLFNPYLGGDFDVYLAFILRAHRILKAGGFLSMVVPNQFLFNQNAKAIRRLLLTEYDFLRLDVYPRRSFIELPSVAPISFLAQKRASGRRAPEVRTQISYHKDIVGHRNRRYSWSPSAAEFWLRLPGNVFHPLARREMLFLLDINTGSALATFGDLACGARLGRKNPTRTPEPFVSFHARHIRPFHACPREAVDYQPDQALFARVPVVRHISRPKIVFHDIRCVTLASRLVAAGSGSGTMAVSSASMFMPHDSVHIRFFEALLNSGLANAWYKLRDVNRCIKLSVLAELPIVPDEAKWKRVAEIGRQISEVRQFQHHSLASCSAAKSNNVIEAGLSERRTTISRLQEQLDHEIFDLYKLTSRQRKAIGKFSAARVF
jgi:SAM-dependent methyltransferase